MTNLWTSLLRASKLVLALNMKTPKPGQIFVRYGLTRLLVREVVEIRYGKVRYVEGRSLSGSRNTGWATSLAAWNRWAHNAKQVDAANR